MTNELIDSSEPINKVTPEMVAALGCEDQLRSFLAALFIVQNETEGDGQ